MAKTLVNVTVTMTAAPKIPSSKKKKAGFCGAISYYCNSPADLKDAWEIGFSAIKHTTKWNDKAVVDYLDSDAGAKFAHLMTRDIGDSDTDDFVAYLEMEADRAIDRLVSSGELKEKGKNK